MLLPLIAAQKHRQKMDTPELCISKDKAAPLTPDVLFFDQFQSGNHVGLEVLKVG